MVEATLIKYCCYAKNSLYNQEGFTPHQLVFGQNPRLPSVVDCQVPATKNLATIEVISRHLSLLNKSRAEFLKAEGSSRIKRALRANVRSSDGPFDIGDFVYYKRQNEEKWRSPGKIIGMDGQILIVRNGGLISRVHNHSLRKCHYQNDPEPPNDQIQEIDSLAKPSSDASVQPRFDQDAVSVGSEDDDVPVASKEITVTPAIESSDGNNAHSAALPSKHEQIKFKTATKYDSGDEFIAKMLGRAGKATEKHKNWLNLQYILPDSVAGSLGAIDFENEVTE